MPVSRGRKNRKKPHRTPKKTPPSKRMQEIVSTLEVLEEAEEKEQLANQLDAIVSALSKRFGRLPTEDEVFGFLMGSQTEQLHIWNHGLNESIKEQL